MMESVNGKIIETSIPHLFAEITIDLVPISIVIREEVKRVSTMFFRISYDFNF